MAPLKIIFKLVGKVIIGGIVLVLFNMVGRLFGFHISINVISAFVTGTLGVPGVILIIALKSIFRF